MYDLANKDWYLDVISDHVVCAVMQCELRKIHTWSVHGRSLKIRVLYTLKCLGLTKEKAVLSSLIKRCVKLIKS